MSVRKNSARSGSSSRGGWMRFLKGFLFWSFLLAASFIVGALIVSPLLIQLTERESPPPGTRTASSLPVPSPSPSPSRAFSSPPQERRRLLDVEPSITITPDRSSTERVQRPQSPDEVPPVSQETPSDPEREELAPRNETRRVRTPRESSTDTEDGRALRSLQSTETPDTQRSLRRRRYERDTPGTGNGESVRSERQRHVERESAVDTSAQTERTARPTRERPAPEIEPPRASTRESGETRRYRRSSGTGSTVRSRSESTTKKIQKGESVD